jgi:hypothetical protein
MRIILLILLSLIFLSCGLKTGSSTTETEKETIKLELQSLMNELIKNNEIGNLEKSIEPYLNSPDFFSISNGQISDYKNFILANEQYFEALKSQKYSNSTFGYTFLNNENVIITWGCTARIQMKNDLEMKLDPYTATLVFKKVDDSWRIVYGHGSGVFVPISES